MKHTINVFFILLFQGSILFASNILSFHSNAKNVLLASQNSKLDIIIDVNTHVNIQTAAKLLTEDLTEVLNGNSIKLCNYSSQKFSGNAIIIGSEKDELILKIIKKHKINLSNLTGRWEGFQIKYIKNPIKGIKDALVIIGSDPRGTAYGAMEISKQAGISPWNWWADVPVTKQKSLFITKNIIVEDAPNVKYRGIFINDEAPALSNWSKEKFGGFNHLFYEKVFELMLRLKANYIWPAMWGNAFYDDDSENIKIAQNFGIVIGTSHHEPLMRAHDEWRRYGQGTKWNYEVNKEKLQEFWRKGVQRATNEKLISVGMRGDGDEPMTEKTAINLLETIVKDQREIIREVTSKSPSQTPQLWALYKEVQDYYDNGMKVPEDITLLFCDDNWGNVRRLPQKNTIRKGGYGMYYHFDYVGGPRNYKWINTNYLPRIWDQMTMCYQNGIDKIWIVNVGDIKPMELPISFFLDMAWNPKEMNYNKMLDYFSDWSRQQFGSTHADEIANLLQRSSQLISLRKPELLSAATFSLISNNEFENIVRKFEDIEEESNSIYKTLDSSFHNCYFQLVHHPIEAMDNLYKLYYYQALNHLSYYQKSSKTNKYADTVRIYFQNDSIITAKYHTLHSGKWNHMMSQTHIGYTYWQQPEKQIIPPTFRLSECEINENYINQLIPKIKVINLNLALDKFEKSNLDLDIKWETLKKYGRYGSAITTFPMNHKSFLSVGDAPQINIGFDCKMQDSLRYLHVYHSPTLDVFNNGGLKYAISIDNSAPKIYAINEQSQVSKVWEKWVADNIIHSVIDVGLLDSGMHNLKVTHMDPCIILQACHLSNQSSTLDYLGPNK